MFEGFYKNAFPKPTFNYDISPDGQRFLMVSHSGEDNGFTQINVVYNWFEELKRLVPTN